MKVLAPNLFRRAPLGVLAWLVLRMSIAAAPFTLSETAIGSLDRPGVKANPRYHIIVGIYSPRQVDLRNTFQVFDRMSLRHFNHPKMRYYGRSIWVEHQRHVDFRLMSNLTTLHSYCRSHHLNAVERRRGPPNPLMTVCTYVNPSQHVCLAFEVTPFFDTSFSNKTKLCPELTSSKIVSSGNIQETFLSELSTTACHYSFEDIRLC